MSGRPGTGPVARRTYERAQREAVSYREAYNDLIDERTAMVRANKELEQTIAATSELNEVLRARVEEQHATNRTLRQAFDQAVSERDDWRKAAVALASKT